MVTSLSDKPLDTNVFPLPKTNEKHQPSIVPSVKMSFGPFTPTFGVLKKPIGPSIKKPTWSTMKPPLNEMTNILDNEAPLESTRTNGQVGSHSRQLVVGFTKPLGGKTSDASTFIETQGQRVKPLFNGQPQNLQRIKRELAGQQKVLRNTHAQVSGQPELLRSVNHRVSEQLLQKDQTRVSEKPQIHEKAQAQASGHPQISQKVKPQISGQPQVFHNAQGQVSGHPQLLQNLKYRVSGQPQLFEKVHAQANGQPSHAQANGQPPHAQAYGHQAAHAQADEQLQKLQKVKCQVSGQPQVLQKSQAQTRQPSGHSRIVETMKSRASGQPQVLQKATANVPGARMESNGLTRLGHQNATTLNATKRTLYGQQDLPSSTQATRFTHPQGHKVGTATLTKNVTQGDTHQNSSHEEFATSFEPHEMENQSEKLYQVHDENRHIRPRKSKKVTSIRIPVWQDNVEYDESETVMTIDAEENLGIKAGKIHPRDIMKQTGLQYFVIFNGDRQPIRKGGNLLIKFLGYVAKLSRFCPIGAGTWHQVNKKYKVEIIELVRSKFVIPNDEACDKAILQRVGKARRLYKHSLKKKKFTPNTKSITDIQDDFPDGHDRNQWLDLVEFWDSKEGKDLSKNGIAARSLQDHLHTTGSKSYADTREDFIEKHKREPTSIEFFELTHSTEDGNYPENTTTNEFLEKAKSKVKELLPHASPSKSRADIENDVFYELMYGDNIPKRPVGYGFGVKSSAVFGVQGEVRKSRDANGNDKLMDNFMLTKKNQLLNKKNEALESKVDQGNEILLQVLNRMRTGDITTEFLDATTEAVMRMSSSQVPNARNNGTHSRHAKHTDATTELHGSGCEE